MGKFTQAVDDAKDKWKQGVQRGIDELKDRELNPFISAENLAVRHKLEKVEDKNRGKRYVWSVWTASDTIAKGAAYRATQRSLSTVLFRTDANVRIIDESSSGGILNRKAVEVLTQGEPGFNKGKGYTKSLDNAKDRWADAMSNSFGGDNA